MTIDGDGKEEPEPNDCLLDEDEKDGSDGLVGEEQIGSGDNKLNHEDAEDESGQAVLGEAIVQVPRQNSRSSACWERFLHLRSIKVLLVENDDSTRHVVTALLRNCNYEVIRAANGLQAWELLENLANHIDLVLTEVVMPCLSGIGLLCKIMSHKTPKNVPVIMMSSHDSMGLVFKCLSKGAVDFLVKPIRKNELKNLWQHVWRRCHSSCSSGSESGTQAQKSVESISCKKYDNSSSSDGDYSGSFGLNIGDGSDSGSGTQSSWTKQAAEVDSPEAVSPLDQITKCPDSTCAQVICPNVIAFGKKCVPITATRECQELGKHLDDVARGKELVIGSPGHQDFHPELPIEAPAKLIGGKQKTLSDINLNPFTKKLEKRDIDLNVKIPSTKYKVGNTNASDPQTGSRGFKAPKGLAKDCETKDSDSERLPTIELGLKSLSEIRDTRKTIKDDCNVLKHSELSAFSRYNTALNTSRAPNENTGSCYLLDHCLDEMKKELVCSSRPCYQCLNGFISNNNIDMASSTNNDVSKPEGFCLSTFKPLKIEPICTSQQTILVKANDRATTVVLAPPRGSHQDLPVQHLHPHYNQFEKEQKLPPCNHDDWNDKLAVVAPPCGSSNALSGPIGGNTGIYSLNRSASGSNHGSNGHNGSSTAANAEGMNIGSVNALGGKSGSGDGSGNNTNQNKLTQREVALTKFHQKRKERCFQKKVRYQSRKRL